MLVFVLIFAINKYTMEYKKIVGTTENKIQKQSSTENSQISEEKNPSREDLVYHMLGEAVETEGLIYTVDDYFVLKEFPEDAAVREDLETIGLSHGNIEEGYSIVEVDIRIQGKKAEYSEYSLGNIRLCDDSNKLGLKLEIIATNEKDKMYSKSGWIYCPKDGEELSFKLFYVMEDAHWDVSNMYLYIHNQGVENYTDKARRIKLEKPN
jgi:hypothetical protein